jgi:hypothetical protein
METRLYLVIHSLVFNFIEGNRRETTEEIVGIFDNIHGARELVQKRLMMTRNIIGEDKVVKEDVDNVDYLVEGGKARSWFRIEQVNKLNVELPYYEES